MTRSVIERNVREKIVAIDLPTANDEPTAAQSVSWDGKMRAQDGVFCPRQGSGSGKHADA
eukprot:2551867-Rhodomonas_salina.1